MKRRLLAMRCPKRCTVLIGTEAPGLCPIGMKAQEPDGSIYENYIAPVRKSILCGVAVFLLVLRPALGDDFTSFEEIWKKSQIFRSQPSFDTTPITVKIGSVVYRVPRNYLIYLEPAVPTLKVTFPGFQPLA